MFYVYQTIGKHFTYCIVKDGPHLSEKKLFTSSNCRKTCWHRLNINRFATTAKTLSHATMIVPSKCRSRDNSSFLASSQCLTMHVYLNWSILVVASINTIMKNTCECRKFVMQKRFPLLSVVYTPCVPWLQECCAFYWINLKKKSLMTYKNI